jgi:hypothetical protein
VIFSEQEYVLYLDSKNAIDAIDAIGGDPATVQELVAFARSIAADELMHPYMTIVQQDALAAALAKIPEAP